MWCGWGLMARGLWWPAGRGGRGRAGASRGTGGGGGAGGCWGGGGRGEGGAAYDVAFLDLLGEPAQLGLLRARGLITADTVTVLAFADHRIPSEGELRRRCGVWGGLLAG